MSNTIKNHRRRDRRRRIENDAAAVYGARSVEVLDPFRVTVGARSYGLIYVRAHRKVDSKEFWLAVAHDDDFLTVQPLNEGDHPRDAPVRAEIDYSRYPDPWGDANALCQIASHEVGLAADC